MINPSNSSLVENFNFLGNQLRRKRKFSDMMNTSISITQGILNNSLYYKNLNLDEIPESFFYDCNNPRTKFETKKRKLKNNQSTNDFIYRIEKEFLDLKIQKIESFCGNNEKNNELQLHPENSFDNSNLFNNNENYLINNSVWSNNNFQSSVLMNNYSNGNGNNLLGKKSKHEQNINNFQKSSENENVKINNYNNLNQINSLNSFDYLIEDEEIIKINNHLNSKSFYEKNAGKGEKEVKNAFSKAKNIEESFNECAIEIDMNEFKNQPNNQNFFNSELTDLDTINTSRNSNLDDLSLSFLTEYTNKNVSGNIISNAIETEKLMMKLFDVCNPALQPTEKNVIILYSDMQKLKKRIREICKKINTPNYKFSPMDLDFFNLMNNNASFSQIYSSLLNNVTNEDEIMVDTSINCDNIDDKYDFSMIID